LDYRFSWPRDAAFTLQALQSLGCDGEAIRHPSASAPEPPRSCSSTATVRYLPQPRASDFAGGLDRDHGRRLVEIADLVCDLWREPDARIWE
jgi:hypothetical protein